MDRELCEEIVGAIKDNARAVAMVDREIAALQEWGNREGFRPPMVKKERERTAEWARQNRGWQIYAKKP